MGGHSLESCTLPHPPTTTRRHAVLLSRIYTAKTILHNAQYVITFTLSNGLGAGGLAPACPSLCPTSMSSKRPKRKKALEQVRWRSQRRSG